MTTGLILNMSQAMGLPVADVEHIVATAPRRYKEFRIPKRNGRGWRQIAQPSRELKILQRYLIDQVLAGLPVHEFVHGYVEGRGIKSNAAAHIGSDYLLKLDLTDFFPSLVPVDFVNHIKKYAPTILSEEEIKQAELTMFWIPKGEKRPRLCIGAPSSPFLSNTLMFDLDVAISKIVAMHGVCYSRYADDMSFSSNRKHVLSEVQQSVVQIINKSISPHLRVNDRKTIHVSRAQRRVITGVTISSTGELSIGRDRKRLIRAMVHHHVSGKLTVDDQKKLRGLISFAMDVEPQFASSMKKRLVGSCPLGSELET